MLSILSTETSPKVRPRGSNPCKTLTGSSLSRVGTGQALSIKFDDTPFVSRPPRREGFLSNRQTSTGGDLLSRISGVGSPAGGAGAERNGGRTGGGNRGREGGDVPRGLARGYRRGGPAR